MSESERLDEAFSSLASDVAALCSEAIDAGRLDEISNEAVGQIFASIVRLYAEKSQNGTVLKPFGRNSSVSATDVAIGCTAMLDFARIEIFELGAWQRLNSVNRHSLPPENAAYKTE